MDSLNVYNDELRLESTVHGRLARCHFYSPSLRFIQKASVFFGDESQNTLFTDGKKTFACMTLTTILINYIVFNDIEIE